MIIKYIFLAFLFYVSTLSAQTFINPNDYRIAAIGRISYSNPEALTFTYPGIQFHLNFEGTSIAMKTKPGSGYFMIELDDMEPFKVHSADSLEVVNIAEGLENTMHSLIVTYVNEGLVMKPVFYGFILDDGCQLGERPGIYR